MFEPVTGEIFFRCTACRRRLAVEARARGLMVDCPGCHASLLVPERSTVTDPAVVRRRSARAFMLIGGLACGAAGWWLARGGAEEAAAVAPAQPAVRELSNPLREALAARSKTGASSERALADARALEQEYSHLQSAHRAVSRQYEDLANWVLTNLRGRFLLKDRHVGRLRFSPVGEDYSVHPDLADFLAVNEQESGLMQDLLQYGRAALLGLQRQYAVTTQAAPGQVSVYIPPFDREGAALREDLYSGLQTVLGADRFNRMIAVGEEELVRAYDYFGAAARTLVFELAMDPAVSKQPYLVIRDGWVIPKDASRRVTETTEEAVTELPPRYNAYLPLLPEFVATYAKP
ncbi:MAG TPA: hypothetical protein PKE12_07570 [Kiritimatiellia bacterium]|nr:hypothetical protein [Kiritimatiellia bacterium]